LPDDPNPNRPNGHPSDRRLNSWKAIGAFFERDERTVRRWEIERGMPVHRVPGAGRSSVYAYASELAEWLKTADTVTPVSASTVDDASPTEKAGAGADARSIPFLRSGPGRVLVFVIAAATLLGGSLFAYLRYSRARSTGSATPVVDNMIPGNRRVAANPQAQDLYLQGLYHWNQRTPQGLHDAVDDFTQSIVHDPNYAPAYVGLANCYNLMREYTVMPASEAYPRAIAAAQRAIALDDSLADAHTSLAFADFYWSWDAPSAEREFRRAIALSPDSAVAHHWHATFLMVLGRETEALAEIEQARKLDPQSRAILADKGLILFIAGQTDQAVELLRQIEAAEPDFLSPHAYLATVFLGTGDYKDYLPEARKTALLLHDADRLAIVSAGEKSFAASGATGMLRAMLRVEEDLHRHGKFDGYELAQTYCLLGDKQHALQLLDASVEKHEPNDVAMRVDHTLEALHGEPEFGRLLAKVGLPPIQ